MTKEAEINFVVKLDEDNSPFRDFLGSNRS